MSDDFLDRLVGSWNLTGTMGSTELRQTVKAGWVIQGHFLQVHFVEEGLVPPDKPRYEAIYMLGHDRDAGGYTLHLFDTFGAGYARTVGIGTRRENSLEFLFEYPNGLFSNTFTWNDDSGEWTMLLRQQEETGEWKVFAKKTLVPMKPIRYPTILFDWGDTVMKDDPDFTVPMVEWETVESVQGIEPVLAYLQSSGRRIVLATSASISDEAQIRAALARVDLDAYFSRIFCFKNTGLPKGQMFYRYVLNDLAIQPSEAVMVGDGFEKDVLDSNSMEIFAIWFNPRSDSSRSSKFHLTIHTMEELLALFTSIDQSQAIV